MIETPPILREHRIDSPQGCLFARCWTPQTPHPPTPIVLLHDSLGSVELWRSFPEALARATQRRVIAYDRLGFGQSAPYPGTLPLDFIAREAEQGFAWLCEHLTIERFIVFGHSVGGGMAVHCAARYPERCLALITESAQAFVEDRTVEGIDAARQLFADPAQVDRLKRYHGDKARWVLDAWIESWLHPDFADWSLRAVLPAVHAPLLAIHGVDDEYGSPDHPALLTELTGGPAQLALMPETRHVPHREREAEVIERVVDFLRHAGD